MKVALLFGGRIKAWQKCYPSFKKHILDSNIGYTFDSFLCHNADNPLPGIERFIELYNVKGFENISIDISELSAKIPVDKTIAGRHMSFIMYFCWHRAFQLMKESGVEYDIIIYLRADAVFKQSLVLSKTKKILENTLYIPKREDWGGLTDQFALGDMKAMEHYTNIIHNVLPIYEKTRQLFHTEHYVLLHNESLKIWRFAMDFQLHPDRW
jgi:hypothetical protein